MKVTYFAHDLHDPAIWRRVRMLQSGGAKVCVIGFDRSSAPPAPASITDVVRIGQTESGKLGRRMLSLISATGLAWRWCSLLKGTDVVLARSLEMLVLASTIKAISRGSYPVVYECLDVHRLVSGRGLTSLTLRSFERVLLRTCDLLIVSSAVFIKTHFKVFYRHLPQQLILENKVLSEEFDIAPPRELKQSPPWRIGWFGVLRCSRTLELLRNLALKLPGQVEVILRGIPARDVLPNFDDVVLSTPGLTYHGPYDRHSDLMSIYHDVDFTWAIDFFEEGLNSSWLLPNRLYEGCLYGSVPLALRNVETGRWLTQRGVQGLFNDACLEEVMTFFSSISSDRYQTLRSSITAIPLGDLVTSHTDCEALVTLFRGLSNVASVGALSHAAV